MRETQVRAGVAQQRASRAQRTLNGIVGFRSCPAIAFGPTRHKPAEMVKRYFRQSDKWSSGGLTGVAF